MILLCLFCFKRSLRRAMFAWILAGVFAITSLGCNSYNQNARLSPPPLQPNLIFDHPYLPLYSRNYIAPDQFARADWPITTEPRGLANPYEIQFYSRRQYTHQYFDSRSTPRMMFWERGYSYQEMTR